MKIKFLFLFVIVASVALKAQQPALQYFRPNDKLGINVFETTKNDSTPFTGLKVRIGGNFSQDYQALKDKNTSTVPLMKLTNGFNLAMANLNIDVQLADGIRLNLTSYLSTRHHEETWVKAGYIQFDKLPFFKNDFIDEVMKSVTIKVGDLEVDYGDQHFRRTDGGNTLFNPFVENYIMDEFATEIGGEVYYHSKSGFFALGGITNGELNPTVVASAKVDTVTGKLNQYDPAFHIKLGYDKQINNDLRFRITGSLYSVKSTGSNTLFFGDRTGSHYFLVMENTSATTTTNAWSGRFNPAFGEQVNTLMINPFVKFRGLEFFGTYEMAKGRTITETSKRKATQYAVDLIYRFPAEKENFWIGARYNSVKASLVANPNDITINRLVGSAGWFFTNNIMLKAEYVSQMYKDFPTSDIRSGGKFNGVMLEAVVGF
jgi:hypothetical protein